jgi:molybdopterin/thiamine biosynthesis adenylyltransferase
MRFSDEEIRRYARQIVLPEVGGAGQEKLREATIAAASEVEALYLAAAGVGTLVVPSAEIAAAVGALNPLVRVEVGNVAAANVSVEQAALFAWKALKETLAL